MSFFLLLNTKEDILKNVGNHMLSVAIDLHIMGKNTMELLWKSMATVSCFGWRKKLTNVVLTNRHPVLYNWKYMFKRIVGNMAWWFCFTFSLHLTVFQFHILVERKKRTVFEKQYCIHSEFNRAIRTNQNKVIQFFKVSQSSWKHVFITCWSFHLKMTIFY